MQIPAYIRLLRPPQWLKNLMLFFPPFLAGTFFNEGVAAKGILPLAAFCCASSGMYIINDVIDRERDSHHPRKRCRPIAAGTVSLPQACVFSGALLLISILTGYLVSPLFLALLVGYCTVTILYTLKLKQVPIIDLFCISAGFLFRLEGGGVAFSVHISDWLFLTVFLLSIFLSTGKRLCEKNTLEDGGRFHRTALGSYPVGFLDGVLYLSGSAVLVTYTLYVISRHSLILTVPICCFGLFRYIFRIKAGMDGDPTESLLHDASLFATGLLWVILMACGLYGPVR